jgi:hypothetical protein
MNFVLYIGKKMAEKDQVLKEKQEYTGIFDFKGFYSFAHTWLKDEGYGVTEERYIEKVKGDSRDLTIEWKATKDLSDYFRIEFKVKFEVEGMTDVEIEIDGQRKQANKGKVVTEIVGSLVMDREGKWETTPFNRFMRDIYNKYIVPTRVWSMRDLVISKATTFKEQLKSFLSLSGRR